MAAVEKLYIENIEVPARKREVDPEAVKTLAASMEKIGLRTPITIRSNDDSMAVLVAGLHRLEAAKSLGWEKIDCFVLDCDEIDAELWEISENLHRAGLSKEQRDEQIRRYAALMKERDEKKDGADIMSDPSTDSIGRRKSPQQREGIASKVAAETGLNVRTVRRVLSDKPTTSVARSKVDADVKVRAAREVAEVIAEHVPGEWWDGLKSNLYAAGAANIAHELTNITGQSIMDRKWA